MMEELELLSEYMKYYIEVRSYKITKILDRRIYYILGKKYKSNDSMFNKYAEEREGIFYNYHMIPLLSFEMWKEVNQTEYYQDWCNQQQENYFKDFRYGN